MPVGLFLSLRQRASQKQPQLLSINHTFGFSQHHLRHHHYHCACFGRTQALWRRTAARRQACKALQHWHHAGPGPRRKAPRAPETAAAVPSVRGAFAVSGLFSSSLASLTRHSRPTGSVTTRQHDSTRSPRRKAIREHPGDSYFSALGPQGGLTWCVAKMLVC